MEFNVTLVSILVIIFLFIPGFFFKRFYFTGQFTKQFGAGIFAERFITSIFWGIIVQLVSISVTSKIVNLSYNNIKTPISNFYTELCNNKIPDCSAFNLKYAASYVLFTLLVSVLLGASCHKIVRILKIDIIFPVLRFSNHWHYYFKGDLLKSKIVNGKVISTELDIILEDGTDKNKLYSGLLSDYTISPVTGDLETIALTQAKRWSNSSKSFKLIPGDCFVMPYSKVINFNMRYNIKIGTPNLFVSVFKNLGSLLAIVSFLAIFFIIPYYFYNRIGLLKIVIAIILSIVDWLFIVSMFVSLFSKSSKSTSISTRIFAITTFVLLITLFTYLITLIIN